MLRTFVVGSFFAIVVARSLAYGQDIPPLEPPAVEQTPASAPPLALPLPDPAAPKPPTPPDASSGARRLPAPHSVLVVPGVTAPPRRPSGSQRSPAISGAPAALPAPAPAPSQSRSPFQIEDSPKFDASPEPSSLPTTPLTIEPLGDGAARDRARTDPSRGNAARSTRGSGPERQRDSERPPREPRLPPWRLPNFLGRRLGRPGADRRPQESAGPKDRDRDRDGDPTTADPESPDAIAKRRIEAQIRSILGDRVQGVEVRVTGRNVLIVARSTRFWQKRAVQRALESLPALAGYRARVDLGQ